ncbi:MAG: 4-hydroxy-tetrahydrodipicolinate synthase [Acidobacteriaceae bacterium]|nr:4-hydroxy-tetrahydrodipicolinate synthase [Acidobacteriaceae bacterium]
MLLHGIFPPITTPFYPDGRVYLKKLEHNVERYSKTPIAGIVVLGSTGEAIMLSDDERREVLKTTRESCAPHKVLIAGTAAESAIETLRLTEYAAELGYDAALVRTPHFYRPQLKPANILAFYRSVADHSPIPVLVYSVPVFTGYDIPPELVIELANHPNIIGIKESGGDAEKIRRMVEGTRTIKRSATVTETFAAVTPRMLKSAKSESPIGSGDLVTVAALSGEQKMAHVGEASHVGKTSHVGTVALARPAEQGFVMKITESRPEAERRASRPSSPSASSSISIIGGLKTRQKEAGFQVLAGTAQRLLPALEAGAVGAVLAFAAPAPTACYEIYAAWKEGDADLARLKQERISASSIRVAGELGIPGLKYALELNGYYGGPPRLPLLPLTSDLKAEVDKLMSDIRN